MRQELSLGIGELIHLSGDNGSGKSSFLRRLLIPQIQAQQADIYQLYFEQQSALQLFSVKAHAAFQKPPRQINNEEQMTTYLLDNLELAMRKQSRPVILMIDESPRLESIVERVRQHPVCIVFASHHSKIQDARSISFMPINPSLSEASCHDG
ncbi:MAG: hypothetical protein U1B83_06915 [Candidatus Cloacimonadaceae bacterium]|nr:hypothetical protein [Candidatus Cloacimonadaceae bacterium]